MKFIYKWSGVQYIVESVVQAVWNYRLSLRMVPVSYKLFVWSLGAMVGSSAVFVSYEAPKLFESHTITIEREVPHAEASEPVAVKVASEIDTMMDVIWLRESTRGKNNFSKCEAIGKVNGIGYAIPGDGSFICFENHEDEMIALRGWLVAKKSAGWSELKMLCTYSGGNYPECKK